MGELGDLPLDRFCNFVWFMITRNAEKQQDVDRLRTQLWQPPVGATDKERVQAASDPRSPWSPEKEKAALTGFASQFQSALSDTRGKLDKAQGSGPAVSPNAAARAAREKAAKIDTRSPAQKAAARALPPSVVDPLRAPSSTRPTGPRHGKPRPTTSPTNPPKPPPA